MTRLPVRTAQRYALWRRGVGGGAGGGGGSSFIFGQYTVPGEAPLAISAPNGTYGPLTVSGGVIDVASNPSTPGTYSVGSETVTVVADRRSISTAAQLAAVMGATITTYSGVLIRPGTYGINAAIGAWSGKFAGLPSIFTFEGDTPSNRPVFDRVQIVGGSARGRVIFQNINWYLPQPLDKYFPWNIYNQADVHMISATVDVDLEVTDCDFQSDLKTPHETTGVAGTGGRLWASMQGINVGSAVRRFRSTRVTSSRLAVGINTSCPDTIIDGYVTDLYWQDCLVVGNPAGGFVRNMHSSRPSGCNLIFHPDVMVQAQVNAASNLPYGRLQFEGCTVALGDVANTAFTGPEATDRLQVVKTVGQTLTQTEQGVELQLAVTPGGDETFILPASASSAGFKYTFRNTTNATIRFTLSGGDTFLGLDGGTTLSPLTISNTGIGIETNGDGVWREIQRGEWRPWMLKRYANFTLSSIEHKRTVLAHAASGPITITGPGGTAEHDTKVLKWDNTTNAVTFVPPVGQTISYYGETPATLTIDHPGLSFDLYRAPGATVWTVTQKDFTAQGAFGNNNPGSSGDLVDGYGIGFTLRNCIMQVLSTNGLKFEERPRMRDALYTTTTLVPLIVADDRRAGFVSVYRAIASGALSAGNIILADEGIGIRNDTFGRLQFLETVPVAGTVHIKSSEVTDFLPTGYTEWLAEHDGYTPGNHPITRAGIVAAARPKAGTIQATEWRGAAGVSDTTGPYNFATNTRNTGGPAPAIYALYPSDGGENIPRAAVLELALDQEAFVGTGNITLYNFEDSTTIETIDVTDAARVSFIANKVRITPTALLPDLKECEVRIPSGVVLGAFGTALPAIATGDWRFIVNRPAAVTDITLVGYKTLTHAGGTTSMTLSGLTGGIGTDPAAGDLVVVFRASGTTANRTLTVTTSGYTSDSSRNVGSAGAPNRISEVLAYKVMGGSPDTSVAWAGAGVSDEVNTTTVAVFRKVDPTTPLDVALVAVSGLGVSAPNPGSITPTTAGTKVVAFSCTGYPASAGNLALSGGGMTQIAAGSELSSNLRAISWHIGISDWTSGALDLPALTFGRSDATDNSLSIVLALRKAP
jgi:hypothetical protein